MARYRWRRAIRGVRIIVRVKNSFLGIPDDLWLSNSENNSCTFLGNSKTKQSSEKPYVPSLHKSLTWNTTYSLKFCNLVQLLTIFCTDVNTDLPPSSSIENMFWCVAARWKINLSCQPLSSVSKPFALAQMFGNQHFRWSLIRPRGAINLFF